MSRSQKPQKVAPAANTRRLRLQIEVLQGGARLVSTHLPMRRHGALALTTHGHGPLALPHYPLPDGRLEFITFTRAGAVLVVEHDWEGFCTSKGELLNLHRGSGGRRQIALSPGDYASITDGNIRIMLKTSPSGDAAKSTAVAHWQGVPRAVL